MSWLGAASGHGRVLPSACQQPEAVAALRASCRTRRRRAHAVAARADAGGIDLVEVQVEGGDGKAVRAALEVLRNKRRERQTVALFSNTAPARPQPSPGTGTDLLADARARHQHDMMQLRTRLNGRLSKASGYARHCERAIRKRDETVGMVHDDLMRFREELAALATLAADSAADPKQAAFKFVNLAERAKALQALVDHSLGHVNKHRVRPVEVSWSGMAEDVRVMGSFDGWTHGMPLTPEERASYTTFSATLQLLPGTYEIKMLVDGQWRVAADWPQLGDGLEANNLLTVGEDADEVSLKAEALKE